MHTGLFDVLHDRADNHLLAVTHRIHIDFYCLVQIAVKQYRRVVRDIYSTLHVLAEFVIVVNDLHRPTTQNVRRPNNNRITNLCRPGQTLFEI